MGQNTLVQNPNTNTYEFGVIPYMIKGHDEFSEGIIQLRIGKHIGPNKGFGVEHIWIEHNKELIKLGYKTKNDVPQFLADLIKPRAPIYCEFNDMRGNHRIAVVRSVLGVAYLERKFGANNEVIYSVVTAFTKKNAAGTKIGSVQ